MSGTKDDTPQQEVHVKRAYEPARRSDGFRVLVDRVWPRGVRKEDLRVRLWAKDIAPSTQLRQWFGHDPARWTEFKKRYQAELRAPEARERIREIVEAAGTSQNITLVYSAKDEERNQAVVLRGVFERAVREGAHRHEGQ